MLYYDAAASSSDRPSAAAAAASYSIRASHVFCGTSGQQRFWIVRIIQYILLLLLFPIQPPALYISTTLWRATKCHFDLRLAPLAAPISFCKKKMFPSPSFLKIIIIVETKKKKDRPFNSSLSIARFSTPLDWLRIALAGSLHSYICALEQTPNKQLIACQSNCQSDVVFSCRFPLFCF